MRRRKRNDDLNIYILADDGHKSERDRVQGSSVLVSVQISCRRELALRCARSSKPLLPYPSPGASALPPGNSSAFARPRRVRGGEAVRESRLRMSASAIKACDGGDEEFRRRAVARPRDANRIWDENKSEELVTELLFVAVREEIMLDLLPSLKRGGKNDGERTWGDMDGDELLSRRGHRDMEAFPVGKLDAKVVRPRLGVGATPVIKQDCGILGVGGEAFERGDSRTLVVDVDGWKEEDVMVTEVVGLLGEPN